MDELVSAAGVTKSTSYRHSHFKDDLVLACLQLRYEERSTAVEAAIAQKAEGEGAIQAVFDAFEG